MSCLRQTNIFMNHERHGVFNKLVCHPLFYTLLTFIVLFSITFTPAGALHPQFDDNEILQPSKSLFPSLASQVVDNAQTNEHEKNSCEFIAVVGRLFNRSLVEELSENFPGVLSGGETIEVEFHRSTPREWLVYQEMDTLLLGVPLQEDAASLRTFAVRVTRQNQVIFATSCTIQALRESDIDDSNHVVESKVHWTLQHPWLHCLPGEPIATMVVSLDARMRDMSAQRRVNLIRDVCALIGDARLVNSRTVAIETGRHEGHVVFLSGDGNVDGADKSDADVAVVWPLACGGDSSQLETLEKVETTSSDGGMSRVIDYGVLEWRVENRKPTSFSRSSSMDRGNVKSSRPASYRSDGQRGSGFRFTQRHLRRLKRGVDSSPGIFASTSISPPRSKLDFPVPNTPGMPLLKNGNKPPFKDAGIPSVRVRRCTYFEYRIPANAFNDPEDGNTRSLKLSVLDYASLTSVFTSEEKGAWLMLDPVGQILYGVPPKVSKQDDANGLTASGFLVTAEDSGGKSATTKFDVDLVSRPRPTNHRFVMYFSKHNSSLHTDQLDTLFAHALSKGLQAGSEDLAPPGLYSLLKSDATGQHMTVSWFDNSLGSKKSCDRAGLTKSWSMMSDGDVTTQSTARVTPTAAFKAAFLPHFALRHVKLYVFGPCAVNTPPSDPGKTLMPPTIPSSPPDITPLTTKTLPITTPTTTITTTTTKKSTSTYPLPTPPPPITKPPPKSTTTTTKVTTSTTSTTTPKDASTTTLLKSTTSISPKLKKGPPKLTDPDYVLKIPVSTGKESRVPIPDWLFVSSSDSTGSNGIKYVLQPGYFAMPLWIAVDSSTQSIVALPSESDVIDLDVHNSTHRSWKGILVAADNDGRVSEKLEVEVLVAVPAADKNEATLATHVFVVKIHNYVLENFTALESGRFLNVIGSLFGDPNTDHIYVHPLEAGSVIFSWHNTTLSSKERCPYGQIATLVSRIEGSEDFLNKVKERFAQANFQVNSVVVQKKNACAMAPSTTTSVETTVATEDGTQLEVAGGGGTTGLIITVVVLICIALLFALIVYKCRSNKNAKRKREEKKRLQSAAAAAAVFPPGSPFAMESPTKNGNAHKQETLRFKPGTAVVMDSDLETDPVSEPLLQRTSTFSQPSKTLPEQEWQQAAHHDAVPSTTMSNGPEAERPPPPAYVPK